jgi:hypothetical protein
LRHRTKFYRANIRAEKGIGSHRSFIDIFSGGRMTQFEFSLRSCGANVLIAHSTIRLGLVYMFCGEDLTNYKYESHKADLILETE